MSRLIYLFFKVANRFMRSQRFQYKAQGAEIGEGKIIIDTRLSSSRKGKHFFIGKNFTITGVTLLDCAAFPILYTEMPIIHKESFRKGARRSYRALVDCDD